MMPFFQSQKNGSDRIYATPVSLHPRKKLYVVKIFFSDNLLMNAERRVMTSREMLTSELVLSNCPENYEE
jgi:hypothetical protein